MRIGSMFARGSGSALKWAALLGVVFALGAGSASAQVTETTSASSWTLPEGGVFEITYKVDLVVPASFAGGTFQVWAFSQNPSDSNAYSTNPASGKPTLPDNSSWISSANTHTLAATSASGPPAGNYEVTGTLRLQVPADPDAEDEIARMNLEMAFPTDYATNGGGLLYQRPAVTGTAAASTTPAAGQVVPQVGILTTRDTLDQEFVWQDDLNPTPQVEGGTAGRTLVAVPDPGRYVWSATARVESDSGSGYSVQTGSLGSRDVPGGAGIAWAIQAPDTDGNRTDDEVVLRLYHAGTSMLISEIEPFKVTFKDIHALPAADKITWKAYGSKANGTIDMENEVDSITEGGDPVHVRVTVERGRDGYPLNEDISVAVVPGEGLAMDYRTEGAPLTFKPSDADGTNNSHTETFKVWALDDNDIAMEDLVLNLVATGATAANGPDDTTAAKPVMLTIMDATEPLLTPMTGEMVMETVNAARMAAAGSDDLWTPGEMFELDGEDLFTSDNTVQVAAMSSSGAVGVSTQGGTVMLQAMEVGTSTITITGTVASSFTSSQTVDNIATIEFDLEVDELPLAIELSGPDDMNIAEGMSAMVTATANRAVNADTAVELNLVSGSGSPADYSVERIMIMNGQTTGTTMLMATEDGMEEAMETLTFEGAFGSGMKTNQVTFNIWDAAVPALPIIAQLLLAAFLAVGGYRRYLRRR